MAYATARHILVDTEEKCNELKIEIQNGASFEDVAKENSNCPSKAKGGDLGKFGPGQMVPEFDEAVFNGDVGVLYGPIKTQFGYHLLEVTSRG
ncbi:MAG: peptidylprolyl isomerase [Sulfurimonas sp.]|nr:MAG: peptidylprolyl isomerase [Sulfurimonas sp.]